MSSTSSPAGIATPLSIDTSHPPSTASSTHHHSPINASHHSAQPPQQHHHRPTSNNRTPAPTDRSQQFARVLHDVTHHHYAQKQQQHIHNTHAHPPPLHASSRSSSVHSIHTNHTATQPPSTRHSSYNTAATAGVNTPHHTAAAVQYTQSAPFGNSQLQQQQEQPHSQQLLKPSTNISKQTNAAAQHPPSSSTQGISGGYDTTTYRQPAVTHDPPLAAATLDVDATLNTDSDIDIFTLAEQQRQRHDTLFQQLQRLRTVRAELLDMQLHQWPTNTIVPVSSTQHTTQQQHHQQHSRMHNSSVGSNNGSGGRVLSMHEKMHMPSQQQQQYDDETQFTHHHYQKHHGPHADTDNADSANGTAAAADSDAGGESTAYNTLWHTFQQKDQHISGIAMKLNHLVQQMEHLHHLQQ